MADGGPEAHPVFDPQPFGSYYLVDKVAVGGMAEVFRAKTFGHSGFQKVVVIKRILSHFAHNPEFVEMFIEEAKLSVELVHPNIAQIHDFGVVDGHYFIAMEAVEGKDVRSLLRRLARLGEHLPFELSAYVIHGAAKGLEFAHRKTDPMGLPLNLVHRDISPSNILVSYGGHVKLVDFGIAKVESAGRESQAGVLKGKFQYMSPEQSRGEPVDHRSDIFSLGTCLWEMLTGHRLFKFGSDLETLEAIKSGHIPRPTTYHPNIPPELESICMTALQLYPQDRYQNASEMQHSLEDYLLPNTPDRLTPHVSTYLRERFGEDIRRERERLERGTEIAANLHYGPNQAPSSAAPVRSPVQGPVPSAEGRRVRRRPTTKTVRQRRQRTINGLVVGGLFVIFFLTVLLGILVRPLLFPEPLEERGFLATTVGPPGVEDVRITVDGTPIGSGSVPLSPGKPHRIEVSAPGFETQSRVVELTEGQRYRAAFVLEEEDLFELEDIAGRYAEASTEEEASPETEAAAGEPEEDFRSAASAGGGQAAAESTNSSPRSDGGRGSGALEATGSLLEFKSFPAGAEVFVSGARVGVTPMVWRAPKSFQTYRVEFRKKGFEPATAVAKSPAQGEKRLLQRKLEVKEDGPLGHLSVVVSPGWAKVLVDGEYIGTTPLDQFALPAGKYNIRLLNERQEIDQTDNVVIRRGEVARVTYDFAR